MWIGCALLSPANRLNRFLQVRKLSEAALRTMHAMATGCPADENDVAAAYEMLQHYLKSLTVPPPADDVSVCHASHHGTQVQPTRRLVYLCTHKGSRAGACIQEETRHSAWHACYEGWKGIRALCVHGIEGIRL